MAKKRTKKIAFGYYGGKFSHLDFILPLLPNTFAHYCEPFGGSAAVLINRDPAPAETYNDLDSEIVNFFRQLRDRGDELVRLIGLTPFSREELDGACCFDEISDLERARRFFIMARQTRAGVTNAERCNWAHCVLTSRSGMAAAVSRWLGSVEGLPEIVQRLQRVQVENSPAVDVIGRYDSPQTLFYCDPPYVHETRGDIRVYKHEMTDGDHEELAKALNSIKGSAVVSGYRCGLMDRLYGTWRRVDARELKCGISKGERTESAWANF
jgi:DNA adenine methylase